MTNEEELFMQELGNDPEYVAWCDQRNQEVMEEMLSINKNKYIVFVYGSLKRGFGNHTFLESSKFLGITETVYHNFRMHPLFGSFPAVTSTTDDAYAIMGELYEVDFQTLKRLDMLEGDGKLYTRRLVSVWGNARIVDAWMYLMPEDDNFVKNNIVYRKDQYVYTDTNHNTQEWFKS